MKTQSQVQNIITLTYLVGTLATSSAFAQGGHVNGPDLKGTSIPIVAEGEVPYEKLQKAATTCFNNAAADILKIILGRSVDLNTLHPYHRSPYAYLSHFNKSFAVGSSFVHSRTQDNNPALVLQNQDLFAYRPKYPQSDYQYHLAYGYDSGSYHFGWEAHMVTYAAMFINYGFSVQSFDRNAVDDRSTSLSVLDTPVLNGKIIDRSILSSIGDVIEEKKFVTNLRFESSPAVDITKLKIGNRGSMTIVPNLTYNFQTVIDCMGSEIAKP